MYFTLIEHHGTGPAAGVPDAERDLLGSCPRVAAIFPQGQSVKRNEFRV